MTAIVDIIGREILDSRGNPTVEVDVVLEDGAHGPRRRALGRLDRRARGGRAARRRQEALPRQGRAEGGRRPSTARSSTRCRGMDAEDQRRIDDALIDARRHARTRAASAPTPSSASRWPSPRRRPRRAGLPLYRYVGGAQRARAAGADDEHHQRRRACRQPDRHPGIHDHAGRRRRPAPRPSAWARRSSTP